MIRGFGFTTGVDSAYGGSFKLGFPSGYGVGGVAENRVGSSNASLIQVNNPQN